MSEIKRASERAASKQQPAPRRPGRVRSWLARRKPSTYQRCLAVHIHFAGPHSALY